jgi:DNA-binding beta-propeller fold protein YncE
VAPLTSVALADGQRSELTPGLNVGGTALAPVLEQDLVYVATIAGVDRVELGGSPSKTNISEVDAQDPYVFAQVRSIAYDITNDRLIVGDTDLDALIAIDATTGERSDFVSRRIGTGPPVIAPRRIAITADQTTAYLADDGGNAAERLFAVDLITGDRQQIGNIGEAANFAINGLALDEEGGLAFVSRHSSIMEVNLETGHTRVVAAPASLMPGSLFESIATLAYDAEENRLLAGDTGINAIVAIDLNLNDAQSIFSQHEERGDGDPFATITSISLDEENRVAYVGNQLNDTILRVDLESGDREVFPTGCLIPPGDELLNQVLFDAAHDRLLIVADGLFMRDLGTGSCVQVPHSVDVLSVAVTADNRLLGTMLGSLVQIDGPSGDVVIISR